MINVQSKLIIYILFKLIDYILYTPLFTGNIGFFFYLTCDELGHKKVVTSVYTDTTWIL